MGWVDFGGSWNYPGDFFYPSSNIPSLCDAVAKLRGVKTIRIIWVSLQGRPQGRLRQKDAKARVEYCRSPLQPFIWLRAKVLELTVEIETGRRMYRYEGGLKKSWESGMELEKCMPEKLADVLKIPKSQVSN